MIQPPWELWKRTPTSDLVEEARKLSMMLETTWMAPLSRGLGSRDSERDLRKCKIPAQERELGSER